ncbi:MAG TPA: hypothetical protein PKE69_02835 [Pyrinomonadaceae bacterium]|nr:hypothetical protein [Pyrinomonadaceae bacterium]
MKKSFETISKIISKWQNVLAIVAIIMVAILHAVIQTYFVQSETSKNLIIAEVSIKAGQIILPKAEAEPISTQSVEIAPKEFEPNKINKIIEMKSAPQIKQRQAQIVQPKPQPKKKDANENRTERLRRAEIILTGI